MRMSSGIRLTALAGRRETFRHLFLGSLTQFVLEPRSLAWECASASDGLLRRLHVRFTPKSRHRRAPSPCPLCAKSGHSALQQNALKDPKMYSVCWVNNRYFERAFAGSLTLSTLAISTLRT